MKTWGRVDEAYNAEHRFFYDDELRAPNYRITPSLHAPFCPDDPTEAMAARRDPVLNFFTDRTKTFRR